MLRMRPPPQKLFPITSKLFELNLWYLAQWIYGSGEMYGMTFPWPWSKVTAVASISKNLLVCTIKWEPLIGSLQNVAALLPSHGYYLIRFWRNSVENWYFGKFSLKISDVFLQGQTLFWPYLRIGWSDWCETKKKCIGWILGTIYGLDLWPHSWPWPWMFQGQISKYLYLWNCWSDWSEMKRKSVNMILGRLYELALWPHPWPWPWSFKVRVWNSFISGMGRPIDNERKGYESSIHDHNIDLCDHDEVGGCTG